MYTLVIDGNNLCYRALVIRGSRGAFGSSEVAKEYDKEIVLSVINGFLVQLLKFYEKYNTNQFIFAWDMKPYHRSKFFPEYKSGRIAIKPGNKQWGPPRHLKEATFKLIRERLLPKLGFKNIFYRQGYEADDIIASIVQTYSEKLSLKIISSDRDLWQLLDYCDIFSPKAGEMTKERLIREYFITPNMWPFFRSLTGDISDSIPGIERVGVASATKFITKTMTKRGKIYNKIVSKEGKEIIRRNLKLMTLPWPGVGAFSLQTDDLSFPAFIDVAEKLHFRQLLNHKERWEEFFNGKYELL